jgi:hypothetical protein
MIAPMPRDGAIIFSDLIGKLEVLQVACEKCERDGRYILAPSFVIVAAMPSSSNGSMNLQPSVQRRLRSI